MNEKANFKLACKVIKTTIKQWSKEDEQKEGTNMMPLFEEIATIDELEVEGVQLAEDVARTKCLKLEVANRL